MVYMLFLAGCGCPDLADTSIEDPHGIVLTEQRDAIIQAVADFEAWTGRDSVCVSHISVHQQMTDEHGSIAGNYVARYGTINITAKSERYMRTVVFHELCHALDRTELHILETAPELFEDAIRVIDPERYDTPEKWRKEIFAQHCERGPRMLETRRTVDAMCGGATRVSPQSLYLNEEVYPYAQPPVLQQVVPTVIPPARPLALPWGEQFTVQDIAVHGDTLVIVALSQTDEHQRLSVASFDPDGSLRSVAWVSLDGPQVPWQLALGDGEAILFAASGRYSERYWWQEGQPSLELLPDLPFPENVNYGFIDGDTLTVWDLEAWEISLSTHHAERIQSEDVVGWGYPSSSGPLIQGAEGLWRQEGTEWEQTAVPDAALEDLKLLGGVGDRLLVLWRTANEHALATLHLPSLESRIYVDCDTPNLLVDDTAYAWSEEYFVVLYEDGTARWVPMPD